MVSLASARLVESACLCSFPTRVRPAQAQLPWRTRVGSTPGSFLPQVNAPKTTRTFCKSPKCRKHETFKITQYKAGKASLVAQGAPLLCSRTSAAVRASWPRELQGAGCSCVCQPLVQPGAARAESCLVAGGTDGKGAWQQHPPPSTPPPTSRPVSQAASGLGRRSLCSGERHCRCSPPGWRAQWPCRRSRQSPRPQLVQHAAPHQSRAVPRPPLPPRSPLRALCCADAPLPLTGKRRYDRKQAGFGGQTKPVFHKKVGLRP